MSETKRNRKLRKAAFEVLLDVAQDNLDLSVSPETRIKAAQTILGAAYEYGVD